MSQDGGTREDNRTKVLRTIWEAGEVSRASLSRKIGLAPSTVGSIVQDLLDQGLIVISHVARSKGGRPPVVLRFATDRFAFLGVDLGASHVRIALMDAAGKLLRSDRMAYPVEEDPHGTLDLVDRLLSASMASAFKMDRIVVGVGLSVPSPLDPKNPDELSARILPAWEGVPVLSRVRGFSGLPVWIDNDANVGALAEYWWGAGQRSGDMAYIKVATGVGAGLVIDGRLFRGSAGIAGEIGHTAIDPRGPKCRCGLNGCLEAMIGSGSLTREVRARLDDDSPSVLARVEPTPAAIAMAARADDAVAREVLAEAGAYLGTAVANLVNLLNPARVVLGGSLPVLADDLLLRPMEKTLAQRTLGRSFAATEVVVSELKEAAVVTGAATQVLEACLADPSLFAGRPDSRPHFNHPAVALPGGA
ncbi:MAG: ROK family transcriptional regulator [Deltaproteobacteria bacterium]|nr:ROK family transcriptional regulator [Deltaproteobacteria bacterium]